jgi:hypothetical protein
MGSRFSDLARLTESTGSENRVALETAVTKLILEIQAKTWKFGDDDTFTSFAKDLNVFITRTQNSERTVRVLKALHFKQLKERQSEIREAHTHTFEWVFDHQSTSNFSSWLQSENGIYWIEGKPGSGKSTLMKFLVSNHKTARLLQRWSGAKEFIMVNHFFWSAGTKLQKSLNGLFRSLLFQIFSNCPEIILDVAPDRWGAEFQEEWGWAELLSAFEKIASLDHLPSKLCLFIDGLDEYDGDHVKLIEILRTTAKSANIKICASSRPWYDFIDAFGHQRWKLCVQDLTANDILLYIKDNLEQDPRFQKLKRQDRLATTELVEEILTKSCGVFLWVYLVVRSLLRGLRNSDRIPNLRQRLYELPSELEKYFELILDSIEKVYRQTTARIFKVMIAAQGTVPLLAFHFLDQEEHDAKYALSNFVPIPLTQFDSLRDEKKRQLHANCRDLLWVTPPDQNAEIIVRDRVGFLHRTVMDFLQTKHMDTLLSDRAGKNFRPIASLSMMHLAMLKTHAKWTSGGRKYNRQLCYSFVLGVISYAHQSEEEDGVAEVPVLDELQLWSRVLSLEWQKISGTHDCNSFLDYTVRAGLQLYISNRMRMLSSEDPLIASTLFRQALRARFTIEQDLNFTSRMAFEVDLSTLEFLLDNGASPNAMFPRGDKSVWYDFLHSLRTDFPKQDRDPAWDMTTHIDPSRQPPRYTDSDDDESNKNEGTRKNSKKPKAAWLPNWYQACEILISHGAKDIMHRDVLSQSVRGPKYSYVYAMDFIIEVFTPDQAQALRQCYKKMEPSIASFTWSRFFSFRKD